MKNLTSKIVLLVLVLQFAAGFAYASDVVANPKNEEPINKEILKLMLTGREKFWNSGDEVVIAILKSDPDAENALAQYSGMTTSKFKNHWQRIAFSGRGKMPKMFSSMEELISFVQEHHGAIGIVSRKKELQNLRTIDLGLLLSPALSKKKSDFFVRK